MPDVPATVSVNVAGVTMGDSCRVRVEVALPPDDGVTDDGLIVADTPVGAPDAPSATAELKPPRELMVTEVEAVPPTTTVTGEIELNEKSITFTWKVPVLVFPAGSFAVQVTVVVPTGKVAPDAGLHETARSDGRLSGSVAETAKVTTAPLGPVALVATSAGKVKVGAVLSSTTTVALAVPVLPAASVAEHVMGVLPTGKVLPEAGVQLGVRELVTMSAAAAE